MDSEMIWFFTAWAVPIVASEVMCRTADFCCFLLERGNSGPVHFCNPFVAFPASWLPGKAISALGTVFDWG